MVLLKEFDERGVVFHTHATSRKGRELEANPRAALLLYWDPLGRQVRIEGPVERVPAGSRTPISPRPRGAQIGAHASRQSEAIATAMRSRRASPSSRRVRRPRRPEARDVGRLPPPAGDLGVLAAPRQPPARPLPLPPRRRRRGSPSGSTPERACPRLREAASRSSQRAPTSTIHATASSSGPGVTS